jgi:phenylalanyl-tRNA synthetase alpha chain
MDARPLPQPGTLHPLTLLGDGIVSFFEGLGYSWAEGPEVEAEWFNFDVLNMDATHLARAADHTYYLANPGTPGERSGLVLRAHTSPVQARAMLRGTPPQYKVCIGRTFRPDPLDATHSPVFNQLEGLAVDRGLTMDDLKSTLDRLAQAIFGPGIVTRLRPYHFAYAEPAAEIDVQCKICQGRATDCRTCSGEGWIEWGGCGMVHKTVLANCGIDSEVYSAFSFGIGVERTLMLREGISDLRHIVDGDVQFALTALGQPRPVVRAAGLHAVGRALVDLGHVEITSFPFTDEAVADQLGLDRHDPRRPQLTLTDPLPGQGRALRTTLLPGLLDTLRRNADRGLHEADIVEQGRVFHPALGAPLLPKLPIGAKPSTQALDGLDAALPTQPRHLAAASTRAGDWTRSVELAAAALQRAGWRAHATPTTQAPWLDGRCMAISVDGRTVGQAGQLTPSLLASYGLPAGTSALELNLDALPLSNSTQEQP